MRIAPTARVSKNAIEVTCLYNDRGRSSALGAAGDGFVFSKEQFRRHAQHKTLPLAPPAPFSKRNLACIRVGLAIEFNCKEKRS
jgi:hypothetical protein